MNPIRVVFAPDWRDGVPYQRLLSEALGGFGVEVRYLHDYRRGLPLSRLLSRAAPCDLLHLHWPEAYYPHKGDYLDWLRNARYPVDLALATRRLPLAVTAHNLHAHNRAKEPFVVPNSRATFRRAAVTFVHSSAAADALVQTCRISRARICAVPHGIFPGLCQRQSGSQ